MPLDSAPVFSILDRITDADGNPVSGGTVEFYAAGTSTPKTVYSDATLTTSLGTSVSTDAGGYPVSGGGAKVMIYVGTADYKVVVKDAGGSTLITHDNIPGAVEIPTTSDTATPETPVVSRTSTYTILSTDQGKLINADPTGGSFAVTLPSAVTVGDGWKVGVRHAGASTSYVVTARTTGGQTIGTSGQSAATSISLQALGHTLWFVSDGAGWSVDSEVPPVMGGRLPFFKVVTRLTAPPASPVGGARYIINGTPTGTWSTLGYAENDVVESDGNGSWLKYTPQEGWLAHVEAAGIPTQYVSGVWTDWLNMVAPVQSYETSLLAAHTEASGTAGGASVATTWTKAKLNSSTSNTITDASHDTSAYTVSLPAGKYRVTATKVFYQSNASRIRFKSNSTATVIYGGVVYSNNGSAFAQIVATLSGTITVAATEVFQLEYYCATAKATDGLGLASSASGVSEVYATLEITNIAQTQGPTGPQGAQGPIGYMTGQGGAVTQSTNKSTGVTLNKSTGEITMNSAALAANTAVGFLVTNTTVGAADVIITSIKSGATYGAYSVTVDEVSAGSFRISLRNNTGGSLSEAVKIQFARIPGATS